MTFSADVQWAREYYETHYWKGLWTDFRVYENRYEVLFSPHGASDRSGRVTIDVRGDTFRITYEPGDVPIQRKVRTLEAAATFLLAMGLKKEVFSWA